MNKLWSPVSKRKPTVGILRDELILLGALGTLDTGL